MFTYNHYNNTNTLTEMEDKKKITIFVAVTVETNKTPEQAFDAIKRGIIWGLDVKGVAPPLNVEVVKRTN